LRSLTWNRRCFHELTLATRGRELYEFAVAVAAWITKCGFQHGLVTMHLRHTSASMLIQKNADPDVRADPERFFHRLVPDGDPLFAYTRDGADDMPAHTAPRSPR
jgi:secondary thiamine-phosphate synthase enzyme